MHVTCEVCGAEFDMDDSIAPPTGIVPSCANCDPASPYGSSVPGGFDAFDASDVDDDRDKTSTYQLAGLGADLQSLLNSTAQENGGHGSDELFGTLDETGDGLDEAVEAEPEVQASDIFALFGAPGSATASETEPPHSNAVLPEEASDFPGMFQDSEATGSTAPSDPLMDFLSSPPSAAAPSGASSSPVSTGRRITSEFGLPSQSEPEVTGGDLRLPTAPSTDELAADLFGDAPGAGMTSAGNTSPLAGPTLDSPIHPASAHDEGSTGFATFPPEENGLFFNTVKPGNLGEDIFEGSIPSKGEPSPEGPEGSAFDGSGDLLAALGLSTPPTPASDIASRRPDSDAAGSDGGSPSIPSIGQDAGADGSAFSLEGGAQQGGLDRSLFGFEEDAVGGPGSAAPSKNIDFQDGGDDAPLELDRSGMGVSSGPIPSGGIGAGGFASDRNAFSMPPGMGTPASRASSSAVPVFSGAGGSGYARATGALTPKLSTSMGAAKIRRSGVDSVKVLAFALLTILVLAGLAWLWTSSGNFTATKPEKERPPEPVAAVIENTVMHNPEILEAAPRLTVDELVQQGIALLRYDTAKTYREARNSFIQALSLDPNRTDAMALYVEATLHARPTENYMPNCRQMMDLVLEKAPYTSLSHRVNAFLLLREEKEQEAIDEADKAVVMAMPEEKADALLILGSAYLKKSPPVALEKIDSALRLDQNLKRAIYFQGLAAENSGNLLQAARAYDKRLSMDAKERDSMQGLVRIYLKLGHLDDAKKALASYLKSYPNDASPKLWEAALVLRLEKNPGKAATLLKNIESTFEQLSASEKSLFFRLSAERRLAIREYTGAARDADKAIELDSRDAAAHFLALKIAVAQRKTDQAKPHLKACKGHLPNGIFNEFRGRLALMDGDVDTALEAFRKSSEENPRRIATLMAEGVLELKKNPQRAWPVLKRVQDIDPYSRSKEAPAFDDFAEPERPLLELIRPLVGTPPAKADVSTRWAYQMFTALIGYHLGDVSGPSRILDQIISDDPSSALALVYRAQMEFDRQNFKKAKKFIDTAINVDPRSPIPWYLRGRLFWLQKDLRNAHDSWVKVLELSPRHIDAEIQLAFLAIAQGERDDALSRLRRVLFSSPHLENVRSALFDLERSDSDAQGAN